MEELGAGSTRAVLEVRSHDVPFLIEEGQTVCRLVYEPMAAIPDTLYGAAGGTSNYQSQGFASQSILFRTRRFVPHGKPLDS